MTLHQATRSRKLVELFYNAGHIISYSQILKYDTAMAEDTFKNLDPQSGAVVPKNLVSGRFVHFSGDNIDIDDSTLNGKNTFHATQLAAWQRGPAEASALNGIEPSIKTTLSIPPALEKIQQPNLTKGAINPDFGNVKLVWFKREQSASLLDSCKALDLAFLLSRQSEEKRPSWTSFNQSHSIMPGEEPPQTTVGYMPIILAPAHELSTLNILVLKAQHVAEALGNRYTVITVDQALYPQLMELK